ncbi:MAG: PAS domain-containing sensor histidine kinase [Patescibacteria group bacterium]
MNISPLVYLISFLFFVFLAVFFILQTRKREKKVDQFNEMLGSMSDGVLVVDLKNRIRFVNIAAKRIVHLPEKKEATIFDFVSYLGNNFNIIDRLHEAISSKKEYSSEHIQLGDKFFQIFVFPVQGVSFLGHDIVTGGMVVFHNITSEVAVETLRKDFTSMLIHELRSPLDGIKKITELLNNKNIKLEQKNYEDYVELIHKNSSSMLELVSDILDVDKIEAGKFTITKQEADIRKVVFDRVEFYQTIAKDAGVSLSAAFSENVPKNMMFDPDAIEHVLSNLISNAIKYTNKNGEVKVFTFLHEAGANIEEEAERLGYKSVNTFPEKVVQVLLHEKESFLVIMVADTGIGIKQDDIRSIFSKFKQLNNKDAVSKKSRGTGLGLVIAKGVVNEHKGEIGVLSKEREGSTFFFTLPLV